MIMSFVNSVILLIVSQVIPVDFYSNISKTIYEAQQFKTKEFCLSSILCHILRDIFNA